MFLQMDRGSTASYLRSLIDGTGKLSPDDPPASPIRPAVHPAKLLTAREAAKLLGCCEKTLWTLTDRGEIPVVKIGRSVRYDPQDLSHWIEKNKRIGGNAPAPAE